MKLSKFIVNWQDLTWDFWWKFDKRNKHSFKKSNFANPDPKPHLSCHYFYVQYYFFSRQNQQSFTNRFLEFFFWRLPCFIRIRTSRLQFFASIHFTQMFLKTANINFLLLEYFNCLFNVFYILSEHLFRTMADLVVSEGYAAVGYSYINVDDCWLEKNRGSNNELVADRRRFPSGMRSLSDYVKMLQLHCLNWFTNSDHFRFIRKVWSLVFMKTMAITRALVIPESSVIQSKTPSSSLHGTSIMLSSMAVTRSPPTWISVSWLSMCGLNVKILKV